MAGYGFEMHKERNPGDRWDISLAVVIGAVTGGFIIGLIHVCGALSRRAVAITGAGLEADMALGAIGGSILLGAITLLRNRYRG